MIQNKTVETFLSKIHEALGEMPTSEKASIIVDLYDFMETKCLKESQSMTKVIKEMGTPLHVVESLKSNRNKFKNPPHKKAFFPLLIRWGVVFVGGSLLLCFLTFGAILWNLSPVVKITPEGTSLLGGLLKFQGHTSAFECSLPDYRGKKAQTKTPEAE